MFLECWQSGEDEAERGDHHEQAGDNSHNLDDYVSGKCKGIIKCEKFPAKYI